MSGRLQIMDSPRTRSVANRIGSAAFFEPLTVTGSVPAGAVLVDGAGVGDIGSVVLRDRKHLSEDGLVVVVATVDQISKQIVSGPDIVSRGFVYVKESEDLMRDAKRVAEASLEKAMRGRFDYAYIKGSVRDELAKFIFKETKCKPMILPVIMDI